MPTSYRLLLRTPSLASAYVSVLLSAVPLGMITLGLILSVQSWSGSLSLAGTITALFTVGNAVGLAAQGSLIDRVDDRTVVLASGSVSGLCLAAVATLGAALPPVPLGLLVLVAGVTVPAITAAVRRRLPRLVTDATTRSAGYALLAVIFQVAFAVGPLLVSVAVVLPSGPATALLLGAVMILAASVVYRLTVTGQGSASTRVAGQSTPRRRFLPRRVAVLYAVATLSGIATGITTVAVPAVTGAAGATAAAGLVFAAAAIGEVIGAMIFGSRSWPLRPSAQLRAALLAAGCMAAVVFAVSQSPPLLIVAAGVGGAVGAPVTIRLSSMLDQLTTPETLGLAYAVLAGIGLVAAAVGTSLAGQVGGRLAHPGLLLLGPPVLLGGAAATVTLARRVLASTT